MKERRENKILEAIAQGIISPALIAKKIGQDANGIATEMQVQSSVLTLARKGRLDKEIARKILGSAPMAQFLNEASGSRLKKAIPSEGGASRYAKIVV